MKKIVFGLMLLATSAQAQITLTNANIPANANRQFANQVLKLDNFTTPLAGVNQVWEYGTSADSNFTTGNFTYSPAMDAAFPTATRKYNLTQQFAGFPITSTQFEPEPEIQRIQLPFRCR